MTRIAVREMFPEGYPVEVSEIEIVNGGTIPTYRLMKRLEEENKDSEFHFVMGSDLIPTLKLWHDPVELVTEVKFVIYNRLNGDDTVNLEKCIPEGIPKQYSYNKGARNIFGEISSTEVRRRIAEARE